MAESGPTSRHLVCQECYDTLFSADGWQSVMADGKDSDKPEATGYRYTSPWTTIKNASTICNWCKLLPQRQVEGKAQVIVRYYKDNGYNTPVGDKFLTVIVKDLEDGGTFMDEDFLLYTTRDNSAASVIKARDRITQLWTEESFSLAKACIDNCAREHQESCPPLQTTSVLPDRVVDCIDTNKPRILLTNGKIYESYVTLSYVWGGPQPMLTTENVDKYTTDGLEMTEFPQTIRDAVTVTNRIGLRYLWIDALCIVQDSPEDKVAQLGKMHAIYKNSYFTINASSASSTYEGFLHQLRPQREPRATIPFPCPDGTVGTVFIAYKIPTVTEGPSKTYWDELEPITWRGWCYQEKVLPARSLLYASDTLKYYCQTETVNIGEALCEESTGLRLPHGTYQSAVSTTGGDDAVRFRQSWLAALFQYTLRSITVPSDRLPAFAAVAEQFSILNKDQYLAGLWRKTLLLDLLWAVQSKGEKPKAYRAPSWSWASVDGLIRAEWEFDQLAKPQDGKKARDLRMATIVDCRVTVANSLAPYGEITEGLLILRGLLLRVHSDEGVAEERLIFDSGSESRDAGSILVSHDTTEDWSDTLYAVPLLWNIDGSFIYGLVIGRESGIDSIHQRVGRFQRKSSSTDLAWMDVLPKQEITIK
ncbi:heterokaryon incompatibility protein-domain-containing protein [Nemania sp. FL0916]|nr:heterokaryon incompatibility protein-domain-containing protein [Nemania sp. FL0916]